MKLAIEILKEVEKIGADKALQLLKGNKEQALNVSLEFCVILDAGHGGIDLEGKYTTNGKFFDHGDFVFYEGVFNRKVCAYLAEMMRDSNIPCFQIYHEYKDTSLADRVHKANNITKEYSKAVLFSVHGNAAANKNAVGLEVFTSKGETESDKIASLLCNELMAEFPDMKFRKDHSDGDPDKEANFYMLRKTKCPAVLSENGFFTNKKEAARMMTDDFQRRCAMAHFRAVVSYLQQSL